jgi:hypothetical protein
LEQDAEQQQAATINEQPTIRDKRITHLPAESELLSAHTNRTNAEGIRH